MTTFSSVPFLAATIGVFWITLAARTASRGLLERRELAALLGWVAATAVWGVVSAQYASSGAYREDAFIRTMPGFWLPFVPMGIAGVMLCVSSFRSGLFKVIDENPRAFVLVQGLRALAVGGVMKGVTGKLPPSFALPIGIPDMLFGLSALWLGSQMVKGNLPAVKLIVWNLLGLAVILPAPVLMQMGLPGPLYTFTSQPDARSLLEYPMGLAPTLIVPMFITMNAMQACVLWLKHRAAGMAAAAQRPLKARAPLRG